MFLDLTSRGDFMYALSNLIHGKEPSWRTVKDSSEAAESEIVVEEIPLNPVWDEQFNTVRAKTDAEIDRELQIKAIDLKLSELDKSVPRGVEDLIIAQTINEAILPLPMQNKIQEKRYLRAQRNSL